MSLSYVRFDVGHHLHVCHRQTLEKYPNSALSRYIAPEFDTRKSGFDYIVIDRDGKHFEAILNFMRDERSLNLDQYKSEDIVELSREADFYCLSELMEFCEQELARRNKASAKSAGSSGSYVVPSSQKLETVFGLSAARELLAAVKKPVIVISQTSIKRFNIESWFAELVKVCDHSRFGVYCFADKNIQERICTVGDITLRSFIVALYEPRKRNFVNWFSAPADDRFRTYRGHYKYKLLKYLVDIQNDVAVKAPKKA